MGTHWSDSSAWRGYDRWRTGEDHPHLNPPDPCEDCECEDEETPVDDCECGCHDREDARDWFDESKYEDRKNGYA